MISALANLLADAIFPKFCFGCGVAENYLCLECADLLPAQATQRCIICQKPSLLGFTHPQCKAKDTPDRLYSIFDYNTFPISKLIITGKYFFIPEIYSLLGELTAQHFTFPERSRCIPIPLSRRRIRWRGFNQSEILAKTIAMRTNASLDNSLFRIKHTRTQKNLNKSQRTKNVSAAFKAEFKITPNFVILIDDVTTTGSTFISATKAVKASGVQLVWCIAVAQD